MTRQLFSSLLVIVVLWHMIFLYLLNVVWVAWWDDGFWVSTIHRGKDFKRVHQDRCIQDGGLTETTDGCDKCCLMEEWGDSVQKERSRLIYLCSLFLCGRKGFGCTWRSTESLLFQVFLDVVESVNILVNSNGQIVRSDVVGALKMRTYLRWVCNIICGN